ncbi:MAG: hypothetical protein M1832_005102 [Thelocarpon impressellum]|nr:MAG: hypothetical protein M1832_005102 [Thelocarpon impressellum]
MSRSENTGSNSQLQDGLYTLPSEMVHEIISYLGPTDFISLVFSNYDLLCQHGLAPRLPIDRLASLLADASRSPPSHGESKNGLPGNTPLQQLPTELLLSIMAAMRPLAMANFVFAHYHHLRLLGIAPPLTEAVAPQFVVARNRAARGTDSMPPSAQGPGQSSWRAVGWGLVCRSLRVLWRVAHS